MNQRDEAWHEENILRARQVELEQQLEAIEKYNENLHEEVCNRTVQIIRAQV
jgi:uncharacterized protein YlxW (UPF0749 family)